MAGPGGGPPRKSHTKSRKGCKTCKRRHIRCDETFPQWYAKSALRMSEVLICTSRNCTKHNCRCDYMDQPPVVEESARSPRSPDLQMTPEVERELDLWRMTGEPPFPELRRTAKSYWHRFSSIDLRLIHHIAGLSIDMHQRGYSGCTVWAQKMPACVPVQGSRAFMANVLIMHADFWPLLCQMTLC